MSDVSIEVAGLRKRFGPTVSGDLTVSGLPAEKVVTVLGAAAVPFSEVSAHRATLEQAYLELTHDAVEYRAETAGEAAR